MQICLTDSKSGVTITIAAELILSCKDIKGDKIQQTEDHTQVITGIHSNQGTVQISCRESAVQVASMVNRALRMAQDYREPLSPEALGFKLG